MISLPALFARRTGTPAPQPDNSRFPRQCQCSLFVVALTFSCLTFATETPNLDQLIFDAVPVRITSTGIDTNQSGSKPVYTATELAQLPHEHPLPVKSAMELTVRRQFNNGNPTRPDDIATLEAALKLQEQKGNAYDKSLTEILLDLGTAYQYNGDFALALQSFQRANQIIRVNNGLFSLDQAPLLRRMINSTVALGDLTATDAEQEYLYYLHTKAYDRQSLELVPALQEFAAWHVRASRIYLPQLAAGKSGTAAANQTTGFRFADSLQDQFDLRFRRLQQAQQLFQQIIDILLAHGRTLDPGLAQAEFALATSNFLMTRQLVTYNQTHGFKNQNSNTFPEIDLHIYRSSYTDGRTALERRVKYLEESASTTPADLAHARLDLVDWLVATGSSADFRTLLETARQDYAAAGASSAEIENLFNPVLPVSVPAFEITPWTRASLGIASDIAIEYRGYIDVDASVNENGDALAPAILDRTAGTPPEVADNLLQSISDSKFRPRILNGVMATYEHVVVRYYYAW